ncbi:hypothetical protein [Geodermatophilus poikilotrophus]|uniref:Uncharacterized protein n=1 Tax=Geodermatophilus poikilotrophus TaxID=1333667 RepID=A0A1I0F8D1_9ACTN|nr:hypothetical protein [Geodermatophilus poikilotrophus]SET54424.1 hypothetical protein SAMN04488546_2826 [Geodermatophilus poikilotrophus]
MQVATRPASVAVMALALLCTGTALAGPAAAVDDDARPDARVTHGPSCRPGGVVIEVAGGTVGHAVTLGTSRRPAGEQSAEVAPGAVVVLSTGPVDWGETIDPFLRYTALDGSGAGWVDELTGYDFTRPAAEDCAAISPPAGAAVVPQHGETVPMPVPGLPDPDSPAPAGTSDGPLAAPVSAREAAAVPDGVPWPVLAAGGALVATGTGLVLVAGSRRPGGRARAPRSFGSA